MSLAKAALLAHRREVGLKVMSRHAKRLGLTAEGLLALRTRDPAVCAARKETYRELRALGWSYPMIGWFVGRHHSTIIHVLNGHRGRSTARP